MKRGERGEPKVQVSETYAADVAREVGETQVEGRDVGTAVSPVVQEILSLPDRHNELDRKNRKHMGNARMDASPEALKQQSEEYREKKFHLEWLRDALARIEGGMPLNKAALDYLDVAYVKDITETAEKLKNAHDWLMEAKKDEKEMKMYKALDEQVASLNALKEQFEPDKNRVEVDEDRTAYSQAHSLETAANNVRAAQRSSKIGQRQLIVESRQSEMRRKQEVLDTVRSYPVSD